MAGNNLQLDQVRSLLTGVKKLLARLYRPGMSTKGFILNIIDYVGDKNAAVAAAALSLIITLWTFSLFTLFSAIIVSITSTILIFIIAKLFFYKPKEVSFELDGENTVISYVKDVHISGESEIVIHSQPGYGKEKNTFVSLQLYDSIAILNCRNITSITDKSYHDIVIRFFHPIEGDYTVHARSSDGAVAFEIISQSADNCRINFLNPIRKRVSVHFVPAK